jgi:hypothetical protein
MFVEPGLPECDAQARYFGFVLNQMAFGASDRAATMSGQPSRSKSAFEKERHPASLRTMSRIMAM